MYIGLGSIVCSLLSSGWGKIFGKILLRRKYIFLKAGGDILHGGTRISDNTKSPRGDVNSFKKKYLKVKFLQKYI